MTETATRRPRRQLLPTLGDGIGPVLAVLAVVLMALRSSAPPTGTRGVPRPAQTGRAAGDPGPRPVLRHRLRGFDLSVGSLVTAEVVIAARLLDGDEAATAWVLPLLMVLGPLVGLVNGLITTRLRVPSFIITLGMMLVLDGAVFLWTGGAPRERCRRRSGSFGREGFEMPLLGQVPWSVLLLAVLVVAARGVPAWGLGSAAHGDGRQRDARRASAVAGRTVHASLAFVLSGISAAIARDPARRVRRSVRTGRATDWSSRSSRPSSWAGWCSAGVGAPSSQRWRARSRWRLCSHCSTCSVSPEDWSPPCRGSSSSPPWRTRRWDGRSSGQGEPHEEIVVDRRRRGGGVDAGELHQ